MFHQSACEPRDVRVLVQEKGRAPVTIRAQNQSTGRIASDNISIELHRGVVSEEHKRAILAVQRIASTNALGPQLIVRDLHSVSDYWYRQGKGRIGEEEGVILDGIGCWFTVRVVQVFAISNPLLLVIQIQKGIFSCPILRLVCGIWLNNKLDNSPGNSEKIVNITRYHS